MCTLLLSSSKWWEMLGFHEVRTAKFIKAVFAEFLATALLIVSGCGSCVTMDAGKPLNTLTPALTFAMTVAYIVWTFNHISGAHINPVVTLGFLVTGQGTVVKTIAYTIAQCGGAIAGSAILWYMIPESWRGSIGSTTFHEDVTTAQGFAIEAVSTFMLMLGVFSCGDRYRTDHAGSVALTVGLMVFIQSAWAGKPTGCSMNPARTLGPALISGTWDHHWVYWLAPTVGSILGSLLYHHVLAEPPPDTAVNNLRASNNAPTEKTSLEEKDSKSVTVDSITTIARFKGFDNQALDVNIS